jgi:hypothetical protein
VSYAKLLQNAGGVDNAPEIRAWLGLEKFADAAAVKPASNLRANAATTATY